MNSNRLYIETFEELGSSWEVNEQTLTQVELYVCKLYKSE